MFDGVKFGKGDVVFFEDDRDADFFIDKLPYYVEEASASAKPTISFPSQNPPKSVS